VPAPADAAVAALAEAGGGAAPAADIDDLFAAAAKLALQ
jgi:hypothetical protein